MQKEPLWTVGTIGGIVTAGLALLVAFGVDITQGQQVAVLGVVAAVAPLVVPLFARHRVYSEVSVARIEAKQRRAPE